MNVYIYKYIEQHLTLLHSSLNGYTKDLESVHECVYTVCIDVHILTYLMLKWPPGETTAERGPHRRRAPPEGGGAEQTEGEGSPRRRQPEGDWGAADAAHGGEKPALHTTAAGECAIHLSG